MNTQTGVGFRVQGLGFRVQGSGFRIQFRFQIGFGCRVRVRRLGFRVQGLGRKASANKTCEQSKTQWPPCLHAAHTQSAGGFPFKRDLLHIIVHQKRPITHTQSAGGFPFKRDLLHIIVHQKRPITHTQSAGGFPFSLVVPILLTLLGKYYNTFLNMLIILEEFQINLHNGIVYSFSSNRFLNILH